MPSKYGFGNKRKSSPYKKNVKPDYPDIDGDGNRKESMKQAASDKKSPMNMNGDPKKAKKAYKEAGRKVDMVRDVAKNPMPKGKPSMQEKAKAASMRRDLKKKSASPMNKYKSDAQRKAVHASKNEKSPMNMMGKGPRHEGNRGKGTGYAN